MKLQIDLITSNAERRTFSLVLNELGPWPESADVATKLKTVQARIYDAFDAAVLGAVAKQFPDFLGWNCIVRVVVSADAPKNVDELVRRFNEVFEREAQFVGEQQRSPYCRSVRVELVRQ